MTLKQNVIKLGCELYGKCTVPTQNEKSKTKKIAGYNVDNVLLDEHEHIHHNIPQQMATFLNLDYNRLVSFLKSYWKWAELQGKPYFDLKTHLDILNLEKRLYEYARLMKDEYLFGFPNTESLYSVLDILIRNSKDIHSSAGTEEYIRFMHNLVSSGKNTTAGKHVSTSDINIYFPGNDMFRTSDGKWVQEKGTLYISNTSNIDISSLKNREISQKNGNKIASAIIVDASPFVSGNFSGIKLTLENITANTDFSENIKLNISEYVYPVTKAEIINGGTLYEFGTKFQTTSTKFTLKRVCEKSGELNIGISGNTDTIKIKREKSNSNIDFSRQGGVVTSNEFFNGVTYILELDSSPASFYVKGVNNVGSVTKLEFDKNEPAIGLSNLTITGNGSFETKKATLIKSGKFFKNSDGFTSDRPVLQDSKYYQDFAYEIQITVDDTTSPNMENVDMSMPIGMIGYKNIKSVSIGCMMNNAPDDGFYRKV